MCVIYQLEPQIHLQSLKIMHQLLSATKESYFSWALSTKTYSIVVPSVLISLHSSDASIRSQTIEIVETLAQSIGPALTAEVTYAELLKYLHQFAEEIILDRDQLLSRLFAFLTQDDDVQSLLPAAVRCVTRIFYDSLLECIVDERTPLLVVASLLQTLDYLNESTVIRKLAPLAHKIVATSNYPNDAASQIVRCFVDKFDVATLEDLFEDQQAFAFVEFCVQNFACVKIRCETGVVSVGTLILQKFSGTLFDSLDTSGQKYFLDFVLRVCSCDDVCDVVSVANSFMKKITLNCELLEPYFANMKTVVLAKKKKVTHSLVSGLLVLGYEVAEIWWQKFELLQR